MSQLIYSDRGLVIPDQCEEVNQYRRAVKELVIPSTNHSAHLFFLARPYRMDGSPLMISINGQPLISISAQGEIPAFRWYALDIPKDSLIAGRNRFVFWAEGSAMNAWTLAVEAGWRESSGSYLSLDNGSPGDWQHKGRLGVNSGEYTVRVRIQEGEDPEPPDFIKENPDHPRLNHLRGIIPDQVKSAQSQLAKVHQLLSWTSTQFEYRSSAKAALYTPWDADTILAWGNAKQGQNGQLPITMCVHYAILFISCCQSLGIEARPAVFTESLNGFNGHFAAEVWLPDLNKWVFADPNMDAMFYRNEVPMSVSELRSVQPDWLPFAHFGPGFEFQVQTQAIKDFTKIFNTGRFALLRGIWPRSDFYTHPEASPPAHGALAYCETDFIWQRDPELGMFPFQVNERYFEQPPKF